MAGQPAALIGGLQQVAVPLSGCTLLASPDAVLVAVTNGGGSAGSVVPIPALTPLLAVTLFWQSVGLPVCSRDRPTVLR